MDDKDPYYVQQQYKKARSFDDTMRSLDIVCSLLTLLSNLDHKLGYNLMESKSITILFAYVKKLKRYP